MHEKNSFSEKDMSLIANEYTNLLVKISQKDEADTIDSVLAEDLCGEFDLSKDESLGLIKQFHQGVQTFNENFIALTKSRNTQNTVKEKFKSLLENSNLSIGEQYKFISRLKKLAMDSKLLVTTEGFTKDGISVEFIKKSLDIEYLIEQSMEQPTDDELNDLIDETSEAVNASGIYCQNEEAFNSFDHYLHTNNTRIFAEQMTGIINDEREKIILESYIAYKLIRSGKIELEVTADELEMETKQQIIANAVGQNIAAENEKQKCIIEAMNSGKFENAVDTILNIGLALTLCAVTAAVVVGFKASIILVGLSVELGFAASLALSAAGVPALLAAYGGYLVGIGPLLASSLPIIALGMEEFWDAVIDINSAIYSFVNDNVLVHVKSVIVKYGTKIHDIVTKDILPQMNRKWNSFKAETKKLGSSFVNSTKGFVSASANFLSRTIKSAIGLFTPNP